MLQEAIYSIDIFSFVAGHVLSFVILGPVILFLNLSNEIVS